MPLIKEEYERNILSIVNRNCNYTTNADQSIKDIVSRWSINKEFIYNLFGQQEIISSDILELQNEEEDIANFFKIFKENLYKYFTNIYKLNIFSRFLKEAVGLEGFKNNRVLVDWEYETKEICIKIFKGMKFSKAIKFFFEENDSKNQLQNYYSTFSQKMYSKKKGYIKLSIHPYDFLSISDNDKDWDSCHSFYDGDYRIGNLNYMVDSTTLIAYYITEDDNYDRLNDAFGSSLPWNSKAWRMLIHLKEKDGKIFIMFNKEYPYFSLQFFNEVTKLIKKLFDTNDFCEIKDYENTKIDVCVQKDLTCQYNDLKRKSTFYCFSPSNLQEEDFENFISIGEPVLCLECGQHIAIESKEGTCVNCTQDENCHCSMCDCECDIEDLFFLEKEGKYICPDCLETYYIYCDGCGEYIHRDDACLYNNKNLCKKCYEEEVN